VNHGGDVAIPEVSSTFSQRRSWLFLKFPRLDITTRGTQFSGFPGFPGLVAFFSS
jgi:hypothetical protein